MSSRTHLQLNGFTRSLALLAPGILGLAFMCWLVQGMSPAQSTQGKDASAAKPATESEVTGEATSTSGITTEVKTNSPAKLSKEDIRQASLLGSNLLMAIHDAREFLDGGKSEEAKKSIQQGLKVVGILRQILPRTTQTTIVKDRTGAVIFEDTREIDTDQVPLYEVLAKVNFLEPVVEAKKEAAEIAGVKLADTEFLHTNVTLKLDFVERRLNEAVRAKEPKPADEALARAQSEGIAFSMRRRDQPLAEVRDALWFAQRSAGAGNYLAAKANLLEARQRLAIYRDLMTDEEHSRIVNLSKEIEGLERKIEGTTAESQKEAVTQIKAMFDTVLSWFGKNASDETRPESRPSGMADKTRASQN